MEETKRLLVENSHLPMSIILVGVGRGDMTKMDILDDDNRTMSWNGRRSERDIVQFVEMSKYLPDQCLDPFTFHSVMDAANAKYHLARVGGAAATKPDILEHEKTGFKPVLAIKPVFPL